MTSQTHNVQWKNALPFTVRKLARSGNSRYLSVGTLLPLSWVAVKVTVVEQTEGVCILKLEQIK